jgi:prepilin peptidase CpaA
MVDLLCLLVFPALMAFAAASDLVTMTISNRVSLALVVGFFALAVFLGMDVTTVATHVGIAFGVLLVGFFCFSRGWIGGGDAKLAAATVLWLGVDQSFHYLVYASLLGGLLTLLLLNFRSYPLPQSLARQPWIMHLHQRTTGVPYGIALAAAALIVYPETGFMRAVGL